ncbi:MAG TPA: M23 family metallopeptidase [Thermoanaerobaculia bacterium]|jgi:murein DD-endopeptidase MepM/ murein hydrolase activator NlpD|nr:M23 family metallopeptidase [Thermoanaerobaculia bacterium]
MKPFRVRNGWVSRFMPLLCALFLFTACASTTTAVVATAPPPPSEDDDFSQLIAQMRSDLNRNAGRTVDKKPAATAKTATVETKKERDKEFAARAKALFAPLNGYTLQMPVVGIRPYDLANSWGNARDGGKRKHKGIDIFAAKGTPIVAVADGVISYLGEQPKGGNCLWLTTENGASFYYAHLDRWAPGLYEGMEVRGGELLGYVGNTGNAKYTPSHLHFGVNENDEMVNPYPILTRATVVARARVTVESGSSMGTR